MKKKFVAFALGLMLEVLAFIMIIPAIMTFLDLSDKSFPACLLAPELIGFVVAIISSFIFGTILKALGNTDLPGAGIKEGFAIVTFGWIFSALFGSFPLYSYFIAQVADPTWGDAFLAFTNAYFEVMSGFTTTGSTILTNIEILPKGLLFWRSLTHWLGGMGIVTLVLAILPAFGVASYQMFRGEVPGPVADKLVPRLAQTAKVLWLVYAVLTFLETGLLMLGGMPLFDSLCHSFGTLATGGFSTKNASIAAYNSPYIQWVIIVFMFLAGMNFMIHYGIMSGLRFNLLKKNKEFHFYSIVIAIAIVISVLALSSRGLLDKKVIARTFRSTALTEEQIDNKLEQENKKIVSLEQKIRHSAFQVISITTTTGFATADFDIWPNIVRYVLVLLMFFGGCAGSTGGGIKMIRIMLVLKSAWREVKIIVQPRLISPVKLEGVTIPDKRVSNIFGFISLFVTCFLVFSAIMSLMVDDFSTAFTSVAATMCNIGPGLAGVGAVENYAWIAIPGKWVLSFCMLLGRLEIYTVIIALSPISWRK